MDADFWLERWRDGRTHFHQAHVTPLLAKYWPTLQLPAGSRVLVPLCGKSLDMVWLAQQGHQVLGVELSSLAVEQFYAENGLQATVREAGPGRYYTAGAISIYCGDIFDLGADVLGECVGAFDRAALVALPAAMRARYAQHVYGQLADAYRGLLITLDYEQSQMDGPPFSVRDDEVQAIYAGHSEAELIDRRDILAKEPKFAERGLAQLDTLVYRLRRNSSRGGS
ncbi:thiopurine S-methyltransferase [Bordetella petrii]|uniref:thiopurine S-methyltransferase n=1 Tax=Bordetella petrii TaxID=94624 RepID=UPI001A964474|nr:thiopurine S-methyltransferase [Bordetella petrii]MBO1110337.1 thiopurine S-methyltransferase [Bordetella petrii]